MRRMIWTQVRSPVAISSLLASRALAQDKPTATPLPVERVTTPPIPVAVDPPPAPPGLSSLINPIWLERPSAEHFGLYYPPVARRERLGGEARIRCLVAADGSLSCIVLSEDPRGRSFGQAALQLSRHFRMATVTRDGIATEGKHVNIPIRFRVE